MNTTTIYTRAEAAQFLRISTRTLDRYQQEGLVKKHQAKQNGRVTYLERDLLRFQNGASKMKDSKERSDENEF